MSGLASAAFRWGRSVAGLRHVPPSDRERIDEYRDVLRRDPCVWCGRLSARGTIEHVIPVAKGGRNHAGNVVGACVECNTRRGCRTILEFLSPAVPPPSVAPLRQGRLTWRLEEQNAIAKAEGRGP